MNNKMDIEIIESEFNNFDIRKNINKQISNFPVVYLIHGDKKIYIGESASVVSRMNTHLKDEKRNGLKNIKIIFHEKFNKSAAYNIETNLINLFTGDEKLEIQNTSQTKQVEMHKYYEKDFFDVTLTDEIWTKLQKIGLAQNSIDIIRNKDIYKLSPYKELSIEQLELKQEIIDFARDCYQKEEKGLFIIKGDAGTGKSVVLSSLMKELTDKSNTKNSKSPFYKRNNYLTVNNEEMIKAYRKIAKSVKNLKKNQFMRPTSIINDNQKQKIGKIDLTIIDEAHLLYTEKDSFNNFNQDNHLEEIIKISQITIIVFDSNQTLKMKAFWNDKKLESNISGNIKIVRKELKNQFRMNIGSELLEWIDNFTNGKVGKLPSNEDDYDFRIFDNAGKMYDEIKVKNEKHTLSRIVATYDYKYNSKVKSYVEEPGFKLLWNNYDPKETWAERKSSINEVGSIYTIQGFDLNYVGVIIGPSIDIDENDNLVVDINKNFDVGAKKSSNSKEIKDMEKIILNGLNVLVKRGIKGLYIYASNDKLRKRLLELQNEVLHEKK